MGKATIEINGKRYDAQSGAFLGEGTQPVVKNPHVLKHQSRVVDGFIHPKQANTAVQQSNHLKVASKATTVAAPRTVKRSVAEIKPASGHKPQHAQVLMRKTVKKPSVSMKPAMKVQAPTELMAAPKSDVAVPSLKLSVKNVDEHRLARANAVNQSQRIKRFVSPTQTATASQPAATPAQPRALGTFTNPVQRATAQAQRSQHLQRVAPRQAAPVQRQAQPEHGTIFEAAIANARSHEQPEHKPTPKANRRFVKISAALASVLVLIGFIAYVNMSAIELHVASLQAGFHAQLPGYQPTGYAMAGGVHNANGVVSFSFSSGNSSYTVQQQSSNWDSQTLLDNVVAVASASHQTYQSNGHTIYVYGKNAAWVNGGVLYNMKINGELTNQQIVNVAASM